MLYSKSTRGQRFSWWTPGHVDVAGNERADMEAKHAAEEGSSARHELPVALRPALPFSKSAAWQTYCYMAQLKVQVKEWWEVSYIIAVCKIVGHIAFLRKLMVLSRKTCLGCISLNSGTLFTNENIFEHHEPILVV
ncbi:hypothetical protein B0H10DRAFT_1794293 [Mycena sp. CBHHK59/15]|nr:hypothetical protein B0H10DRAFT_1794293 [Mycena sp. CBHHK59/15]